MDVPPLGSNRREIFDYMLAKGDLKIVTDEVEEYETRQGGKAYRLKHELVTHWAAEDPGDLDELTKDQLLAVAQVRGVEGVDGRTSKPNLLKALHGQEQDAEVEHG
jgi:hypothetical protein